MMHPYHVFMRNAAVFGMGYISFFRLPQPGLVVVPLLFLVLIKPR